MNIILIVQNVDPKKYGGPATSVPRLANRLASNSMDVSILSLGNNVDEFSIKKYDVKYNIFKIQFGEKLQFSMGLLFHLLRNTNSKSVLHFNELWNFSALIPYIVAKYKNVPYIVSTRGVLSDACLSSSPLRKKIATKLFVKKLLASASAIHVTSSEEFIEVKRRVSNNKIFTIPNIADVDSMHKVTREEAMQNLGLDSNKLYISTMARQIKHKGTHKIIKAIAHENFDWYLLVGGPLEDKKYYKYMVSIAKKYNISDRVIFLGHLDEFQKSCLFEVSEYFILLSDSENFGMVILESLMHSTPVITTNTTPWEKLVEHNAGWWIDDNKKSISNALQEASKITPESYKVLRKNSFLLSKIFSPEKVLKKYINMYNLVHSNSTNNIRK